MMKFTHKMSEKSDYLCVKEKWIIITNDLNRAIVEKKWKDFILREHSLLIINYISLLCIYAQHIQY
jgi:hypothetical protein